MDDLNGVTQGHYYRQQLGCASGIIAWSHRSRFRLALRLAGRAPGRMLDYGCGDGTFLAMVADRIREGCGADIAPDQIADCRERLAAFTNLRFCTVAELADTSRDGAYDVVMCMETLEHCTDVAAEAVLRDLARLVSAGGRVIISVPIETGPTFLLKTVIRKLAAWRGLSDYRFYESYTLRDAFRMLLATRSTALDRPVYGEPDSPFHSHYGFNWRATRERVATHLRIERTVFSPLGLLGGVVSSQAWFLCRPLARGPS
jgi:SAM-dependent methyltransferase